MARKKKKGHGGLKRDVSIDRQSATTSSKVNIERTLTEVQPGVSAIPFDALNLSFTEILTKGYSYESGQDPAQPWTRKPVDPYYYGSELDDHYIPMVQDIVGFELRDLPAKPAVTKTKSGLRTTARPAVRYADISVPSSVATTLAQQLGADHTVVYHYSLEVTEISGEPIVIDVPTNVVDAPVETLPVATVPVDTVPAG